MGRPNLIAILPPLLNTPHCLNPYHLTGMSSPQDGTFVPIDFDRLTDQTGAMNKDSRQSMAARMAKSRSGANDDGVARDQIRGLINDTTPMPSTETETGAAVWTARLVIFLRVMAVLSMAKGLYHWAEITGFIGGEDSAFENQTT
jgi:hypothetical protein